MSGNPLDGAFDDVPSRPHVPMAKGGALTMSSFQIAELVEKRHDNVKRTIETLADQGVISRPQIEEVKIQRQRRAETVSTYVFSGERGKRDSIVVVAQLSPEFTARLVDRWQQLEQQVAVHQPPAISREVTVAGLDPEALGQVGGVFRNVVRKRDAELLTEINRSFQARVFGYIEQSLPLLDDYITGLVSDAVEKSIGRQSGIDPIVRAVEQRMAARAAKNEEPLVLAPMATYRSTRSQANVETVPQSLPRMDLRLFRKMRGWSCQVVAEKVGATASAVSKHERGCCMPSAWLITRYTKISGGRLNADTFFETYRARRVKLGTWPVSGDPLLVEGEV